MSAFTKLTPDPRSEEIALAVLKAGGAIRRHPSPSGPPKGIVKTDMWYRSRAQYDPDRVTLEDVTQRLNAAELTLSVVMREVQLLGARDRNRIDEALKLIIPERSNVSSMAAARVKKKERATQTSVPGNEAESLSEDETGSVVLPSSPDPPLKIADTVPRHIPHPESVFNVHPGATVRTLRSLTDLTPDTVAEVAWRHGMDLVELTDLAYAEFVRRELQCYDDYEQSRDDVRFIRQSTQHGVDYRPGKLGPHVYQKAHLIETGFATWNQQVTCYEGSMRLASSKKLMARPRTASSRRHPYFPGEVIARQRIADSKKDEARIRIAEIRGAQEYISNPERDNRSRRDKYHDIEKVSKRLKVGHHVTTSGQMAALSSALRIMRDRLRKILGMNQRKVGMRKRRLEYVLEARANDPNTSNRVTSLGYWKGTNWWEYSKTYQGTMTPVWVRHRKTVRLTTVRPNKHRSWGDGDLNEMSPRQRMNFIGNLLITRGLNDPLHVSAMQAHLLSHFGKSVLSTGWIEVAKEVPSLRRSRQPDTHHQSPLLEGSV